MAPSIASHLSMPRAIFPIESIAGTRRKQNAGEGEVWRGLYRAGGGEHLDPGQDVVMGGGYRRPITRAGPASNTCHYSDWNMIMGSLSKWKTIRTFSVTV